MAQLMPLPLTVSCSSKIQIGFTFLVLAHPGSPGQRAVKRVCVCVCVVNRGLHAQVIASATSRVCRATYSWSLLFSQNARQATEYLPVYAGPTRAKMPEDGHWRTVTLCSWLSDGVVAARCLLQPGTLKPLCVTSSMVAA